MKTTEVCKEHKCFICCYKNGENVRTREVDKIIQLCCKHYERLKIYF